MVHAGKHIIDPSNGLCEICDVEAIRDLRSGKRPVKHVSNIPAVQPSMVRGGPMSRFVPGAIVSDPLLRLNRPYNEPILVGTETLLREPIRPQEFVTRRAVSRHRTFNQIDRERYRIPRYSAPLPDITRRYMVDDQPFITTSRPGTRSVRVVHSRARTPLPPIVRTHRIRQEERIYHPPRRTVTEMFHITPQPQHSFVQMVDAPVDVVYQTAAPVAEVVYQEDPYLGAPVSQWAPHDYESESLSGRKSYRKLPPGKDNLNSSGYYRDMSTPRSYPTYDRHYSTNQFVSTPQVATTTTAVPNGQHGLYHIRFDGDYV